MKDVDNFGVLKIKYHYKIEGGRKIWYKKCSDCGKIQTFRYKSRLVYAINENRNCSSCSKKRYYIEKHKQDPNTEIVNKKYIFFRICPQCKTKIFYKSAGHRNQLEKSNTICRRCFFENRTIWKSSRERICPNCKNSWKITTLNGYKYATENNSVCSSCRNILYPKMTDEVIKKIRIASIKNLQKRISSGGQISPAYNIKACEFFNDLNKKKGWNLIHATNGGEIYLKTLGYWLDAYDEKENIVVEWYEKHHFRKKSLCKKDIRRKEEIKKLLKCRFIGYDWNGNIIIDECYIGNKN